MAIIRARTGALLVPALCCCMLSAPTADADMLVNGDFEQADAENAQVPAGWRIGPEAQVGAAVMRTGGGAATALRWPARGRTMAARRDARCG